MNICGAHSAPVPKSRADVMADLGQGSLRLGITLLHQAIQYILPVHRVRLSTLCQLYLLCHGRVHFRPLPPSLSTKCNLLRCTVPDVRRVLLLLPVLFSCRNPMLTLFICVSQPTTAELRCGPTRLSDAHLAWHTHLHALFSLASGQLHTFPAFLCISISFLTTNHVLLLTERSAYLFIAKTIPTSNDLTSALVHTKRFARFLRDECALCFSRRLACPL